MADEQKDSDIIKTIQLDDDKDQSDTGVTSSAGNETQSAGVTHDELPTASITVKGMYIVIDCYSFLFIYDDGIFLRKKASTV